jgi:hypothetical protein
MQEKLENIYIIIGLTAQQMFVSKFKGMPAKKKIGRHKI